MNQTFEILEKSDEELTNSINKICLFENLITKDEIDEKTFEEIKKIISSINSKYAQSFLYFIGNYLIDKFSFLADVLVLTGKPQRKFHPSSFFIRYLLARKILAESDFYELDPSFKREMKEPEYYENPFIEKSVQWMIKNDDINAFTSYANLNNVNLSHGELVVNGLYFSFMDFACYARAIKIFKYMYLNEVNITKNTLIRAVEGGSEEIIHFLESKGKAFHDMLRFAISMHRNDLTKYLYDHYHDNTFALPTCLRFYNTELFLYFYKELGLDIGEYDKDIQRTSLHYSVIDCNPYIALLLIREGADPSIKDMLYNSSFFYHNTEEMLSILNSNKFGYKEEDIDSS